MINQSNQLIISQSYNVVDAKQFNTNQIDVSRFNAIEYNNFFLNMFINRYRDKQSGEINSTGIAYRRELNKLLQYIGDVRIDSVDFYSLNQYCDMIKYGDAALATKTRIITTIRSFWSFLAQDGINAIKLNIAKLIDLPASEDNGETPIERVLTEEEVTRLFTVVQDAGNVRDYTVCCVLLATGVRIDELCKINWNDITEDMYGNVGVYVLGKGGKKRLVKLRNDVWKRIREYREHIGLSASINPNDETALVLNKEGNRLTDRYIRKVITKYAERAGIDKPVSPHWFRHTSATFALMGGANVEDVRKQLGHSSLQHTTRYLHNVQGLKETATDHIKVAF